MKQPINCLLLIFITIIISSLFSTCVAKSHRYHPSTNISTKWTNGPSLQQYDFDDGIVRVILLRGTSGQGPVFGCGFICYGSCKSFLFSIFIVFSVDGDLARKYISYGALGVFSKNATDPNDPNNYVHSPQIIWSANRDRTVQENATLEFSKNGDLLLLDSDGTNVWYTNTSGKSVVQMVLNKVGCLVLVDEKNDPVWSSMDHPTDTFVLGQTLKQGQRLTANVSITNSSQGSIYLTVTSTGFQSFVGSQLYYYEDNYNTDNTTQGLMIRYDNGSLQWLGYVGETWDMSLPLSESVQYIQLDYAGHLRVHTWNVDSNSWDIAVNVFSQDDDCAYPTTCGEYGICYNGQCSCPPSPYFSPITKMNPTAGCKPSTAISCKSNKTHQFKYLPNVSYFGVVPYGVPADYVKYNITEETCKEACIVNCSCKAAFFQFRTDASNGQCYLPSEMYSLKYNDPEITGYNLSAFIKVQSLPIANSTPNNTGFPMSKNVNVRVVRVASVGSLLALFLIVVLIIALVWRRSKGKEFEDDDEFITLPGLPTRFTFDDLRIATNDFLRMLGKGGFGSVFEGKLNDGTKIAVKRLDGVGQGKKEFLAEVETIGSIHHLHLVRLVGFCAEKSNRLLIYEYMSNGSLDKWIFYKDHDTLLDWQARRKIIIDIAKGLLYLHEECRQKIVHLDIKPQNILLDENFNAKVSDFGLAKLIDRDQIEVMTRMRGTPGYLAPEWLTSVITEKVDIFSFGVVVLEIICGRRNLDYSTDEENFHLISLLQQKVAENKLVDMIDYRSTDMQLHVEDVTMIMHLAMWCLQGDSNKRPIMSVVLKVLEGSMNVEANLDYNFSNPAPYVSRNANIVESAPPIPSTLSGPR